VNIEKPDNGDAMINYIHPRKNYIIRKSKKLSKQYQIIAGNIDQVIVFITLTHPKTQNTFIDRILITAEAYQIPAHLLFNKTDLYVSPKLSEQLKEKVSEYASIGYPCYITSLKTETDMSEMQKLCTGKVTLLCGLSGTGKSTFINLIIPGINRKTGEISTANKTGIHLTTFSEMIPLPPISPLRGAGGLGFVIDTPGVQEFGIADINKYELSQYFREMNLYRNQCKFSNCLHINEPGCAVLKAVEEGKIPVSRYESYISIFYNEASEVRYER
jgi:ribosome biogenesis GTPase